ncbi:hypothetical protein MY4038_009658 [Beauveria bassiana]
MASSRTSSPVSIPRSVASHPPSVVPDDESPPATPATLEATTDETDTPNCELDIDWENIWHCGKRLVGAERRPRQKRVVGTEIKESWIYRHGANLEHNGAFSSPQRFDETAWKARFVDWVILEDVTLRQASSERLRWLIANGGALASQMLPEHHNTVCSWIRQTFDSRRQVIFSLVKNSKSAVHLSFGLWTASNAFNYLGIVGHFVDVKDEKRDVLLGLPRLVGPHSGENMTTYVKGVTEQYELRSKPGYFMLDNAESNDTCLETLAKWFPMDVRRRCLRCVGHLINLIVRAVIFSSNVAAFEAQLRGATDEFVLSFGLGRALSALRQFQTELAGNDASFTLEIIVDGKTRWNSIYHMVERALEIRSAMELYQSRWQKPRRDPNHRDLTNDFLNATDWIKLERFYHFLKPFHILTRTMEAEEARLEEASHFKSGIDCGWAKLEDYYVKTDRTPVYRAALALHPSYGYDYFERHWKKAMGKPQWYSDMQSAVGGLFDEYRWQAEAVTQAQAGLSQDDDDEIDADVNEYSSFGKRPISSLNAQRMRAKTVSELDLSQTRPIYAEDLDVTSPLERWSRHQAEYPVLYRMAVDLFSIPGMSAECERIFSQTEKMITDERNRLSPETVEADQLQKQWLMRGLVL